MSRRARPTPGRTAARAALLLATAACASSQPPAGGPPDALPPELERTTPESAAVGARPDRVVFEFNEVVSERPQGAATLPALFLVSPRDGEPRVEWKRDRITVRPRRSWRPNTVYTVTMLPGLTDLRGNVRREGASLVFSTGAAIPATVVSGIVFDWPAGRPAPRALVQAVAADDTTLVYAAVADSTGRFSMPHLPAGRYVVRGILDQNNNRGLDRREAWDSASVALADTARVELLAFVRDTIGPRISATTPRDSVLRVAFDKPLDPSQTLGVADFRLVALPDSVPVPIARVLSVRAFEEEERARATAAADSARRAAAAADTARRGPAIPRGILPGERRAADSAAKADAATRPSRPVPETDVVLVLSAPLQPGLSYRLRATDVRNLLGVPRTSERTIVIPRPPAADTSAARSAAPGSGPAGAPAARADSAAAPRPAPPGGGVPPRGAPAATDSTRRPPAPPGRPRGTP